MRRDPTPFGKGSISIYDPRRKRDFLREITIFQNLRGFFDKHVAPRFFNWEEARGVGNEALHTNPRIIITS